MGPFEGVRRAHGVQWARAASSVRRRVCANDSQYAVAVKVKRQAKFNLVFRNKIQPAHYRLAANIVPVDDLPTWRASAAHRISGRLPRFHFVASRLRLLKDKRRAGNLAKKAAAT